MTLHSMQRGKIMTWPARAGSGEAYERRFHSGAGNPLALRFLNLMRRVDVHLCTVPAGNPGNHGWKNFASDKRPR